MKSVRPISLALAALGGQGGGVLTAWLAAVAREERYLVQTTSVPGVAQRTGATLYYLEFFPEAGMPGDGRKPVMALMPLPGDVDVVVATELAEAGRALQRGLVTADRTLLLTSTHRSYTISEKSDAADGRADSTALLADAERNAKRLVAIDMAAIAEASKAVISAVILGAIAGSGALPFAADTYRRAIRSGGIAVDSNLRGFEAGYAAAAGHPTQATVVAGADGPLPAVPATLAARIARDFPPALGSVLGHGVARLIDYQDEAYAAEYLDRLASVRGSLVEDDGRPDLMIAIATGLALWMSFEDTIRVADLKTRKRRLDTLRAQASPKPGAIVAISEFLHPRVDELCGTLPVALGSRLAQSAGGRRWLGRLAGPRLVATTSIRGFLTLRGVAALRRWRRGTLRYRDECAAWSAWLAAIASTARFDADAARELALCQVLVRGYGETHSRGLAALQRIQALAPHLARAPEAAPRIARLRRAAEADDSGAAFAREFDELQSLVLGAATLGEPA